MWTAVAVVTPGRGQTNTIDSIGELKADVAYNTGITAEAGGLTWQGKRYSADQLQELLDDLRSVGVTNGEWLNLHLAISARFGMVRLGCCLAEVVTQTGQVRSRGGLGLASHRTCWLSTVVSGQLTRYGTDCSSGDVRPGQSFYETGASTFIVKNETDKEAVDTVTFVVPGGTPTTALRIDKPQPTTCSK